MKFDRHMWKKLFLENGAIESEIDGLSDEDRTRIMDGFSTSEGEPLWICDKVFPHDRVSLDDGRLIASNEVIAPIIGTLDHDFEILVPTAERVLLDLKAMCVAKESFLIELIARKGVSS